ncbi:MAG: AMMECR1-domain protein [candidate division TM6 bacterium GW2011_GWF2_38_10]|nr:MAG: AMMECR1-domain protein [candidate division TM6 bacterium GW2011_GWF2_38_10]
MQIRVIVLIMLSISFGQAVVGLNTEKGLRQDLPVVHIAHLDSGWYPQERLALEKEVRDYLDAARRHFSVSVDAQSVRALVVPHAGFYYSGACAAASYQTLWNGVDKNTSIKRVIVLAPSHRLLFNGCALAHFDEYKTPLGRIKIDKDAQKKLGQGAVFKGDYRAHWDEHAIEIQLPFLQTVVQDFMLVPLIIGHVNDETMHDIITGLKKIIDDTTLVVVSSDFVHHGDDFEYRVFNDSIMHGVRYLDSLAINHLCSQDYHAFEKTLKETGATICGQNCLKLLLGLINEQALPGLNARLACYYTSAHVKQARKNDAKKLAYDVLFKDVADEDARASVSYAALIFTTQNYQNLSPEDRLTMYEKKSLLTFARRVIEHDLSGKSAMPEHYLVPIVSYGMQLPVGVFVSINDAKGALRGCIGSIESSTPLYESVLHMARQAAFHDTRFASIKKNDLGGIKITLSILTKPTSIKDPKEIRLGTDGIIFNKVDKKGKVVASSVFLPKVPTEQKWNLQTTLEQLALKAGLTKNGWKSSGTFSTFQAFEIKE